jgi:hypothetical protein
LNTQQDIIRQGFTTGNYTWLKESLPVELGHDTVLAVRWLHSWLHSWLRSWLPVELGHGTVFAVRPSDSARILQEVR